MSTVDRFEIQELQARYELEPTLRDVFVEGAFDRELLTEGCTSGTNEGRVYYEIDSVNVPNELVLSADLTLGQKQRVITLALALQNLPEVCQFRCLVDKDLDEWLGLRRDVARLRWTRYTSLETYFLDSATVRRYMVTVARARVRDWDGFYSSFLEALRALFALRLADSELGFALNWVRLDRSLSIERGRVFFDRSGYTRKILQAGKRASDQARFEASVDAWIATLGAEHRDCVRGHDFLFLMGWAIGELNGIGAYACEEALSRLLLVTTHWPSDLVSVVD